MHLIKVKIHIEENVNGNKNNPEPGSHTVEPHLLYPPEGEEQDRFSISTSAFSQLMGRRRVALELSAVPTE